MKKSLHNNQDNICTIHHYVIAKLSLSLQLIWPEYFMDIYSFVIWILAVSSWD